MFLRAVVPTAAAATTHRIAVGSLLSLVTSRCGKDVQAGRGGLLGGLLGGRKAMKALPPSLAPLTHALYQLQRSRMLRAAAPPAASQQQQGAPPTPHPDERLMLMNALLAAGTAASAALICPTLYALMPVRQPDTPTRSSGMGEDGGPPLLLAPVPPLSVVVQVCV